MGTRLLQSIIMYVVLFLHILDKNHLKITSYFGSDARIAVSFFFLWNLLTIPNVDGGRGEVVRWPAAIIMIVFLRQWVRLQGTPSGFRAAPRALANCPTGLGPHSMLLLFCSDFLTDCRRRPASIFLFFPHNVKGV